MTDGAGVQGGGGDNQPRALRVLHLYCLLIYDDTMNHNLHCRTLLKNSYMLAEKSYPLRDETSREARSRRKL
jgi:hypothetical protein